MTMARTAAAYVRTVLLRRYPLLLFLLLLHLVVDARFNPHLVALHHSQRTAAAAAAAAATAFVLPALPFAPQFQRQTPTQRRTVTTTPPPPEQPERYGTWWICSSLVSESESTSNDDKDVMAKNSTTNTPLTSSDTGTGTGRATRNVNELKRNLVQETVRRYKGELMEALQLSQEETLEERLRDLIQVNPVTTTTDSNLLEGESWHWTFVASPQVTRSILSLVDPVMAETVVVSSVWDEEWHHVRQFYLEGSLEEKENNDNDAHLLEKRRRLSLWQTQKRFNVVGLTRTSMDLELQWIQRGLAGRRRRPRRTGWPPHKTIRIFYLDGDLCISTTTVTSRNGRKVSSPFVVYTKAQGPMRPQTGKRGRWFLVSWIPGLLWQGRREQGEAASLEKKTKTKTNDTATTPPTNRIFFQQGSGVTAWRLGEVATRGGVVEAAEAAWEGQDDPFVELSQEERQAVLRPMTLRDIFRAGEVQRNLVRRRRRPETAQGRRRRRPFARPIGDYNSKQQRRRGMGGLTKPATQDEEDDDEEEETDEEE